MKKIFDIYHFQAEYFMPRSAISLKEESFKLRRDDLHQNPAKRQEPTDFQYKSPPTSAPDFNRKNFNVRISNLVDITTTLLAKKKSRKNKVKIDHDYNFSSTIFEADFLFRKLKKVKFTLIGNFIYVFFYVCEQLIILLC